VFVNPTQFDQSSDLDAYPRTPQDDETLLREAGCDYLYRPGTEDVYPQGPRMSTTDRIDFGTLTERMEGAYRPGHFAGVAQVVSRLLDIVQPDKLYLGQKDYQQVAVIRHLIEQLDYSVEVVTVPTVRETDGLALSSRNRRLNPEERAAAGKINQHLAVVAAALRSGWPARELERLAREGLSKVPLLEPEYVEVVDGSTLLPYQDGQPVKELVVAAAVRVGSVRLIDNRIAYRANP
jgi:pantoate--beta-alanine ligase